MWCDVLGCLVLCIVQCILGIIFPTFSLAIFIVSLFTGLNFSVLASGVQVLGHTRGYILGLFQVKEIHFMNLLCTVADYQLIWFNRKLGAPWWTMKILDQVYRLIFLYNFVYLFLSCAWRRILFAMTQYFFQKKSRNLWSISYLFSHSIRSVALEFEIFPERVICVLVTRGKVKITIEFSLEIQLQLHFFNYVNKQLHDTRVGIVLNV